MKKIVALLFLLSSVDALSAGYSSWAVPSQLEYVNDGVLIIGDFGNPGGCSDSNMMFISRPGVGAEKFQSIVSFLLTALTAQKEIKFYSGGCYNVTFHGKNVSQSSTAIFIR